jgi:hypothetical protein
LFLEGGDISGGEPRGLGEMGHFLGCHFDHCATFHVAGCADFFARVFRDRREAEMKDCQGN